MKTTIAYVDDDPATRLVIDDLLSNNGYQCVLFDSGEQCLEQAPDIKPDLILMDVVMPGLSGLDTCEKLHRIECMHSTPVIFLSSSNKIEDRLRGYTAGGDDYIGKPYEPDEILAKIDAAIKRKLIINAAKKKSTESELTSQGLMTTLGEVSLVMHFLQATSGYMTYEQLANKIIQTHLGLGLEISMEIRTADEHLYFCTGNVKHPLEKSVFNYLMNKGRLIDFNERTAVNFPSISILVRNMPVNDEDRYGRIKDYIASIAEGANTKISAIKSDLSMREQYNNLLNILNDSRDAVKALNLNQKVQQSNSDQIISDLAQEIELSFMHLGLSEEQENFQMSIIARSEEHMQQLFKQGSCIDEKFDHILSQMEEAFKNFSIPEPVEDNSDEADDTVILF